MKSSFFGFLETEEKKWRKILLYGVVVIISTSPGIGVVIWQMLEGNDKMSILFLGVMFVLLITMFTVSFVQDEMNGTATSIAHN